MSYAEWKDLGLRAVALISQEPPPAQIFIWLAIAFFVLMIIEGLRANFLPAGRSNARHMPRTNSTTTPKSTASGEAGLSETATARRPIPQFRNPKRRVGDIRRVQAFRPAIRRLPDALDWRRAGEVGVSETNFAGTDEAGAQPAIQFEPLEPKYTQH